MKKIAILLAFWVPVACSPAQQDQIARDAAKQAVRPVLVQRFPGVPLEPAADCIIDNATRDELLALASDAVTGATASTSQIVSNIVARPETLSCLATEGLPVLLGRL